MTTACCDHPDIPHARNEHVLDSSCQNGGMGIRVSYECDIAHKSVSDNGVMLITCKDGEWDLPDGICTVDSRYVLIVLVTSFLVIFLVTFTCCSMCMILRSRRSSSNKVKDEESQQSKAKRGHRLSNKSQTRAIPTGGGSRFVKASGRAIQNGGGGRFAEGSTVRPSKDLPEASRVTQNRDINSVTSSFKDTTQHTIEANVHVTAYEERNEEIIENKAKRNGDDIFFERIDDEEEEEEESGNLTPAAPSSLCQEDSISFTSSDGSHNIPARRSVALVLEDGTEYATIERCELNDEDEW